jgi:hypothetical protein
MKICRNHSFFWLIILLLFIPLLLQATEFEVKIIENSKDLPYEFCRIWKKGDIFVSDGKNWALIGGPERPLKTFDRVYAMEANARGSIISFVPAGKNLISDTGIGAPVIEIKDKRKYLTYTSFKQIKKDASEENLQFEAFALYEEESKKAEIKTRYNFFSQRGRVDVISTLKNAGKEEFEDLDYRIYFNAFHRYYFNPFDWKHYPHLNYRVYQKKDHYLAWLNMNPYQEEPVPGKLSPGESFKVHYILLTDTQRESLLEEIYQIFNIETFQAEVKFKDFDGDTMEVIIKEVVSDSIFFRSFLEELYSIKLPLPEGAYKVRANFFPAVGEEFLVVGKDKKNSCILRNPAHGTIKIKIRDSKGEFVPGKVTFIGLDPTRSPYFELENPVETEKSWEPFNNSLYPQKEGIEVKVPVGSYLVYASRGPEYTLDQKVVEVLEDEHRELIFTIDKVVKPANLISIDPHMHTQNSDGDLLIPERIKSVVAEGVDVAVATDHNYIIDYAPALRELGLSEYLAVIRGNEVTTSRVIHFNTYPLKPRPDEEHNGAINPLAEEASTLFKASRKKDPECILQVNHPRAGTLGYFNNFHLDQESAAYALNTFDTSFDVLEIVNGPYYYDSNQAAIEDWLHLLNRGYFFPLIGSSDSHSADSEEPGYSRTYVYYEGEKGENLNLAALMKSIKKGRSFASNGPLVEFKMDGKYIPGDAFTSKDGKADIQITVQGAPWISVDEIRVIVNGERKIIFPVKTRENLIIKFTEEISLNLVKDSYIAVEVLGKKSLYPVVQRPSWSGKLEDAVLPYALTNPVFIDVDGNKRFDPPLPEKIKLTTNIPESDVPVARH